MTTQDKLTALANLEYKCMGHQMFGIFSSIRFPNTNIEWNAYWRNIWHESGEPKEIRMRKVTKDYFTDFDECVDNAYQQLKEFM